MPDFELNYLFLKSHLDLFIFLILGFMSLIMLWKVIERYWFFATIKLEDYNNIHELDMALERGLTPIFSVGANAPYVGLLGTVLGVLITFYDIGLAGGYVDTAEIMIGLALALKATALGMLVAIPSMMFYNSLSRKVTVNRLRWQSLNQAVK